MNHHFSIICEALYKTETWSNDPESSQCPKSHSWYASGLSSRTASFLCLDILTRISHSELT